jgi:hypothetical protein
MERTGYWLLFWDDADSADNDPPLFARSASEKKLEGSLYPATARGH